MVDGVREEQFRVEQFRVVGERLPILVLQALEFQVVVSRSESVVALLVQLAILEKVSEELRSISHCTGDERETFLAAPCPFEDNLAPLGSVVVAAGVVFFGLEGNLVLAHHLHEYNDWD